MRALLPERARLELQEIEDSIAVPTLAWWRLMGMVDARQAKHKAERGRVTRSPTPPSSSKRARPPPALLAVSSPPPRGRAHRALTAAAPQHGVFDALGDKLFYGKKQIDALDEQARAPRDLALDPPPSRTISNDLS